MGIKIHKLQVMQNLSLSTATRCTRDANMQNLHGEIQNTATETTHEATHITSQTEGIKSTPSSF